MKTLHFSTALFLLLFFIAPGIAGAQILEQTECGTLEVTSQIIPADKGYQGAEQFCNQAYVVYNGARLPAFTYTLFRVLANGSTQVVSTQETDADKTTFTGLDPGNYYVNIRSTRYTGTRATDIYCTIIGWKASVNSNFINTNTEVVGAPLLQFNLEDSYCCGEDISLNTLGTNGEDRYAVTICQKADPSDTECINWKGTGWITGDVPSNIDLLDIWSNNGTSSWFFWSDYYYETMLVTANECSSWTSTTGTFYVARPEAEFSITNALGGGVADGGEICTDALPPVMDASASSCGTDYLIMICQHLPSSPSNCINWRSSGWIEGDVSQVGEINLLDLWKAYDSSSDREFWPGFDYRVSLVISAPCESWELEESTFSVVDNCATNGGGGKGERSAATESTLTTSRLYPTLVEAGTDFLNVEVAEDGTAIFLYDLQGRLMVEERLEQGYSQVAIDALQNGIYFGVITGKEGLVSKTKIVVTR